MNPSASRMTAYGSSPHAGEIRSSSSILVITFRFIPTRRGNTNDNTRPQSLNPVHPHTRGNTSLWQSPMNSSQVHPHTQGKYDSVLIHDSSAGSSPHAGENVARRWTMRSGPSPHAGEIPFASPLTLPGSRFIPTRGGNTIIYGDSHIDKTVHPHAQGKYTEDLQSMERFIPTRRGNTHTL